MSSLSEEELHAFVDDQLSAADRARVLAAFDCVDWLSGFIETNLHAGPSAPCADAPVAQDDTA